MSAPGLDAELSAFLTTTLSRAIRTPLHGLLGFLELLAMGEVTADQQRLLDQMVDSSEELRAVNDRLVLLLGVLGRTQAPRTQPVAVRDLVTELTARTPVPVRVHRAPGTPQTVDTDAGLLLALSFLGGDAAQMQLGLPNAVTGIFQGVLLFCLLGCDVLLLHRVRWRRPAAGKAASCR